MGKETFIKRIVAKSWVVAPGVSLSRVGPSLDQSPAWLVSLASPAHASNHACEWPLQDEPDGDGDDCNSAFLESMKPAKLLGGKGSPDCNLCSTKAGDPIDYGIGKEFESEVD